MKLVMTLEEAQKVARLVVTGPPRSHGKPDIDLEMGEVEPGVVALRLRRVSAIALACVLDTEMLDVELEP